MFICKRPVIRIALCVFNVRGYEQRESSTYINGLNFNDLERGRFNYSSLGGLNNAMRNKDAVNGLEMPGYAYGSWEERRTSTRGQPTMQQVRM